MPRAHIFGAGARARTRKQIMSGRADKSDPCPLPVGAGRTSQRIWGVCMSERRRRIGAGPQSIRGAQSSGDRRTSDAAAAADLSEPIMAAAAKPARKLSH